MIRKLRIVGLQLYESSSYEGTVARTEVARIEVITRTKVAHTEVSYRSALRALYYRFVKLETCTFKDNKKILRF